VEGYLERSSRAVRERRISAAELVEESLRRIESAAELNAVVALRAEEALAESRALDNALAVGRGDGPLLGLPLVVKDIEDAAGLPTSFGSLLHADAPPAKIDGAVPGRLRAAGAILVGKTNVPEFALEGYTDNRFFGPTRNPWALAWSPGGSSGGSAAALAAGLVPIATATDVGGSVRIPAAACGLVGLKPTAGLIGRDPILASLELNSHGPLTWTVADAAAMLSILSGPVSGDPGALPRWRPTTAGLPRRVIAASRLAPGPPLPPTVERRFASALRSVEKHLGLPIEPVDSTAIFPSGYDPDNWFRLVGVEQAWALGRDVIEQQADELDPVFAGYMRRALEIGIDEYLAARRARVRHTQELDNLLDESTVLLSPTLTVEGWSVDGRLPGAARPGLPSDVFNTEPANLTGHPAISLPAGRNPNGVPFGLQAIGPRFGEDLLLAFAVAWEAACPWPPLADGFSAFPPG
jgi:Asp-tRNA(Asn)/Glu-tRNA(Gln) amidotransferase A subunit family amidase